MPRLLDKYKSEVAPALQAKFNYKSPMQIPKLVKVVLNMGVGDVKENPKSIENAANELAVITGQKAVVTKAKKSVAAFRLREGMSIGCKVTLRGDRMYEFVDKLFNVGLPRVRDFRGINPDSFDGRGNFRWDKGKLIFPKLTIQVEKVRGMDITLLPQPRR